MRNTFSLLLIAAGAIATAALELASRKEWQDELLRSAKPLKRTAFRNMLDTLKRDGVVAIDGACSIDPDACDVLRTRILNELNKEEDRSDTSYIPGTRLRLRKPIDLTFGGDIRHDFLIPLNNFPEVQRVLGSAIEHLECILIDAAHSMLPRLHGCTDDGRQGAGLELVELGSLVVRQGSSHQQCHGDYRRYHPSSSVEEPEPREITLERKGTLPPRLVVFVALQDVPTTEHGATAFITGTHNTQAHDHLYEGQGISVKGSATDDSAIAAALKARRSLLEISTHGVVTTTGFRRGDMLIYDASVLHWGGANSVANNNRAMLYFGVSRPKAAAACDITGEIDGYERAPPIFLREAVQV